MQKLDLKTNLKEIIDILKSNQIVNNFVGEVVNMASIRHLILLSKGGYDETKNLENIKKLYKVFKIDEFYTIEYTSELIKPFSSDSTANKAALLNSNPTVYNFFILHKSLLNIYKLISEIQFEDNNFLFNNEGVISEIDLEDKGVLLLQIVEKDFLKLERFLIIINSIKDLIHYLEEIFLKVYNEKIEQKAEVVILDSGSDNVIGIKVDSKIAKEIRKLFQYLIDTFRFKKFDKHDRKLTSINESIKSLKDLENSNLDPQEKLFYKTAIIENSKTLIESKTIPKEVISITKIVSERDLLIQSHEIRLIEDGETSEQKLLENGESDKDTNK